MKRDAIHTSLPYPSPWLVKVQPSLSFDAHLMVVQCFVHEALKQLSKMIVKKTKTCFHVRLHRLFIDTGYFFMHCWGWCECSFGDRLRSSVNQKKLGVELHWENPVKVALGSLERHSGHVPAGEGSGKDPRATGGTVTLSRPGSASTPRKFP